MAGLVDGFHLLIDEDITAALRYFEQLIESVRCSPARVRQASSSLSSSVSGSGSPKLKPGVVNVMTCSARQSGIVIDEPGRVSPLHDISSSLGVARISSILEPSASVAICVS